MFFPFTFFLGNLPTDKNDLFLFIYDRFPFESVRKKTVCTFVDACLLKITFDNTNIKHVYCTRLKKLHLGIWIIHFGCQVISYVAVIFNGIFDQQRNVCSHSNLDLL